MKMGVSGTDLYIESVWLALWQPAIPGALPKRFAVSRICYGRKFRAENGGLSRGTYLICIAYFGTPPPPPRGGGGIEVWGGTYESYLNPILIMQNRAVRGITLKNNMEPSIPLFHECKILDINK